MQVSNAGIEFIKVCEGFRELPYEDGGGYPTIGYGHKLSKDELEKYKDGITHEEATVLLRKDLDEAEEVVNNETFVDLTQNQFDAIVSFVFNVGGEKFVTSTLLKRLNSKRFDQVPVELNRWVYSGGKVLGGLVKRRAHEGELFAKQID